MGSPEFISPQIMQVKSNSLINKIFKVMTFSLRFNIFLVGVGEAIPVMQHTLDEHPPPGIQIQAMTLKVENVSLFVVFCWPVIFSFPFVWPYFPDKSLSIPKTQDVRIGKVIHCYPVRMLNPPSVV